MDTGKDLAEDLNSEEGIDADDKEYYMSGSEVVEVSASLGE